MKTTLIDDYELAFDEQDILKRLGMPADHVFGKSIKKLLYETAAIAKPKAVFMEYPVDAVTEYSVAVGGVVFASVALAKNLKQTKVVYPYVCTCGQELAAYAKTLTDMIDKFAFDAIMEFYEKQIDLSLNGKLINLLPEGYVISRSDPGALTGWPIQEQKKLFVLFGENAAKIGVELSDNYLMSPLKTVSGIKYPAKEVCHDCIYCQREHCSHRKAPYDEKAYFVTLHRE